MAFRRFLQSRCSRVFCAIIFLLTVYLYSYAHDGARITIDAESLREGKALELDELSWKYHAGDDLNWVKSEYDDGNWKNVTNDEINSDPLKTLENWNGRAWFRLRVTVDDRIVNQPLVWRMWQWGASEIYIDGELVQSYGEIKPDGETEYNPRGLFFPFVFTNGGEHTIAVRYSFSAARDLSSGRGAWLTRAYFMPGFRLHVESAENAAVELENRARADRLYYVFIGLFLALALVHFLLFVFYRNASSNLYYSFFVTGLALSFFLQSQSAGAHFDATLAVICDIARLNIQSLAIISLLAFLYVEFAGRPSRLFWILLGFWILEIIVHAAQYWRQFTLVMLLATLVDCVRIMVRALRERREGAWIIALGVVFLAVGVANNVSIERDLIDVPGWLYNLNLYLTVLSVPLTVSIYLARNFARTNQNLEIQLTQVKELSVRQLEHERTEAELRVAHERTQTENERRAKELEEARQLQLSMLPKKVPQFSNLEIAAYMKPATEVGGDYYDFHVGDDGTLTVAVGDATGHGLKAGSIVTATKSLFNAFAGDENLPQTLTKISQALKKMNLRGLFMAMTMLKIKDFRAEICVAGMPPVLIYRCVTKSVEEISIRAMPLGSVSGVVYKKQEFILSAGDCVVVMSDGFPEMFNENGEMIADETVKNVLLETAIQSPKEIIKRFVETGEDWAGSRPPDDDVTFVVLKVRN